MITALCHDCQKQHRITPDPVRGFAPDAFGDWKEKHPGHRIAFVADDAPAPAPARPRRVDARGYSHNADIKIAYQADQTLSNAVASLASSATWVAGYESAWIDNATNLYLDYLFSGHYTVGTSPTASTEIRIYVVTSIEDGTIYPDVFDGTESSETITSAGVRDGFAKLAAVMQCDSTTSDRAYPFAFSVASLFGGVCPREFCLFSTHNTGVNFNSTAGNQVTRYRGAYMTSA